MYKLPHFLVRNIEYYNSITTKLYKYLSISLLQAIVSYTLFYISNRINKIASERAFSITERTLMTGLMSQSQNIHIQLETIHDTIMLCTHMSDYTNQIHIV